MRVVSATHRDLERLVEEGTFREDLMYRLDVVRLDVPPLRNRGNDILLLAQHYLEHFAAKGARVLSGLAPPTARMLLAYDWPGNVRELQNCMERGVALAAFDLLTVDDLPARIANHSPQRLDWAERPADLVSLEAMERRYIAHVLDAVKGNKALAARLLGLHRKSLYRKLAHHGLGPAVSS